MNVFFDFLYSMFDEFLLIVTIALGILGLRPFFKTKRMLFTVVGVLIIGGMFIVYQTQFTSFSKLYDEQLNSETEIEWVTVAINDLDSELPERTKFAKIEDEAIIDQIVDDLSSMELKIDHEVRSYGRKYDVDLVVKNEVEEGHTSTTTIRLDLDKNYMGDYEIVSETNHLQTIKSLAENDEVEWKTYGEE